MSLVKRNAQTIPATPLPGTAARPHALTVTCRAVLLLALGGCTVWRSAPPPAATWTLVAFPRSDAEPIFRATHRGIPTTFSGGCAAPDTVTFEIAHRCAPPADSVREGRERLLLFSNWTAGGYRPDILRAALSHAAMRARMSGQLAAVAERLGYSGLLLDARALGPRDVDALVSLVASVVDSAKARGLSPVGVVVPVADTAAYPGRLLGAVADFVAPRLELPSAAPAALTPRHRMSRLVGARAGEIGAHRIMLLIPVDGYMWRPGEPRVRISFEEAVATARDWGVSLERDGSSSTLRARAPGRGEIWVNDAVLLAGVVRDARQLGIRRFGLYGLGGEDPAVWSVVARAR